MDNKCWMTKWSQVLTFQLIHTGKATTQNVITIDGRRANSLETEISIAICRLTGDKWQSKTLFLAILIHVPWLLRAFSIAAYSVCIRMPKNNGELFNGVFSGMPLVFREDSGKIPRINQLNNEETSVILHS